MKNLYLIAGSVIVIGAILFLRKKKVADDKTKAEETAKAEATLKSDFDVAVHNAGVVQAEAMNIDLINEQKANALLPIYNSVWKQILALGQVAVIDTRLKGFKQQLADLQKQADALGYKFVDCPRCINGSSIRKK
jgi:hypothetical protein